MGFCPNQLTTFLLFGWKPRFSAAFYPLFFLLFMNSGPTLCSKKTNQILQLPMDSPQGFNNLTLRFGGSRFYTKSFPGITFGVKFPVTSKLGSWIGWIFGSNWEKFKRNISELNWILSHPPSEMREPVLKVQLVTANW